MTTNVSIPGTADVQVSEPEEEQRRLKRKKNQAAIDLLRSWRQVDEAGAQEQRDTWEFLKQALDEDRLSPDRKLFP